MNIALSSEHKEWLEEQVSAGHFGSIDEAVAFAVSDMRAASDDDFLWARPYIDQARRSVAAGDVMSGEDFIAELDAKIAAFRAS